MSVVALGPCPHTVFELLDAFPARPFVAAFKVPTQELEPAFPSGIHHTRFLRMQGQSRLRHPCFHVRQRREGFGFGVTWDDEVVCVARHFPTFGGHQMVEGIEIDVG